MRKLFLFLLYLSNYFFSQAQIFTNVQSESYVLDIPLNKTYTTPDIAEYVNKNITDERRKVLAIYNWITTNIRYDTDSANVINMGLDPDAKITAALRRRRGVCENYAVIFNDICIKTGLTSFVVDGYTKQNGNVDKIGHAWCAVSINNTWLLCDPTWDEGKNIANYFLVQPSEMIDSHMPFDPMWQLLDFPVSHKQFYNNNFHHDKNQLFFNYADSIIAYIKMDSLQKFRSVAYRIEKSGMYNDMIKNRLGINKMNIEIIRQDTDVDLYNSAITDLNSITAKYNYFIEYRNNQFTPAMPDREIQMLLGGIETKLISAHKKLMIIDKTEAVFKFSTEDVKSRLNIMSAKVKIQSDFLKLYLSTGETDRKFLFYHQQVSSLGK